MPSALELIAQGQLWKQRTEFSNTTKYKGPFSGHTIHTHMMPTMLNGIGLHQKHYALTLTDCSDVYMNTLPRAVLELH